MNASAFRHSPNALNALRQHDLPVLATLEDNLHGACFTVMKLLAARAIVEDGIARGLIKRGTMLVESTSGTFGLALAMLRSYYGYELTLVSDPVIDPMLMSRFKHLGVTVDIVDSPKDGSYQVARLERVQQLLKQHPGAYFTNQYHNPVNRKGYERLAEHLAGQFSRIDCLVGAVGTGGSMCGTAAALRRYFPKLRVVGVDTHRSVVFGQPNGPRDLRGLGNSLMPRNVDHTQFNQVHWVSAAEAYRAARDLHSRYGLFMGGTSGAAFMVADWYAQEHPHQTVVTIFPDEGYRYTETVYNDAHAQRLPGWDLGIPDEPELLHHPAQAATRWSYLHWNRRTLSQALRTRPAYKEDEGEVAIGL